MERKKGDEQEKGRERESGEEGGRGVREVGREGEFTLPFCKVFGLTTAPARKCPLTL